MSPDGRVIAHMHEDAATRYLQTLREATESQGCVLNSVSYEAVRSLFLQRASDRRLGGPGDSVQQGARGELLCIVDLDGKPVRVTADILADYKLVIVEHPAFGHWFSEETLAAGGSTLLPVRWLCHVAGFRHQTVQLFIHTPELWAASGDVTLVQVRAPNKAQYPGCFDVAAAGHVIGLGEVEGSVFKELSEELGLTQQDVGELRLLGRYEHRESLSEDRVHDVELRSVYQTELVAGAFPRIRFVDGEVAGICLFRLAELKELVKRFPDRVASGLSASLGLYLDAMSDGSSGPKNWTTC